MIRLGLPSRMFGFCALCTLTRSRGPARCATTPVGAVERSSSGRVPASTTARDGGPRSRASMGSRVGRALKTHVESRPRPAARMDAALHALACVPHH